MQQEIIALGHDVHFVGINATTALEYQGTLSNVCSFPFLQDTAATDAFAAMGGAKDDIYVYRSNGTLAVYLKNGEAINTNLSTGEGYSNVRDMLLAVEEEN